MAYVSRPAVKKRDTLKERQDFEASRSGDPLGRVFKDISGVAQSVWDMFRKPKKAPLKPR